MIATESDTMGNNKLPNRSSGFNIPVTGPTTNPLSNRKRMAGNFAHHASHWQAIPKTPIPASEISISLFIQIMTLQMWSYNNFYSLIN